MQDGNFQHTCINTNIDSEAQEDLRDLTDLSETTGRSTGNNSNNIWVRNVSSTPLTMAQEKILSRGPNFAIVPKSPPVGKYIASIENACSQLRQGEAEELRGEIKAILKKIQPPSQISPEKKEGPWQN